MVNAIPLTERARKVLTLAMEDAITLGDRYVGTDHLLRALMREAQADPNGPVGVWLAEWQRSSAHPIGRGDESVGR